MSNESSKWDLNVGDEKLKESVRLWLQWDKNPTTVKEVYDLLSRKDIPELKERFLGPRLKFGTAGIRGTMKAGFSHLSDLIIIQTTQALLLCLRKLFSKSELESRGVCIGFDARYNSQRFAQLAGNIFVGAGVKVHLYSEIVPTPYVAYGVLRLGCVSGIMVTASHNPREDNGFKIFAHHAAQISSPLDKDIVRLAGTEAAEPWPGSWHIIQSPLISDPLKQIHEMYMNEAVLHHSHYKPDDKDMHSLKIAYTPVHGVGAEYVKSILIKFGMLAHNIFMCPEQVKPDPDFATAAKPNPEEGMTVWKYVLATADQSGCTVAFANDPDADRFQLAEKQPDGKWQIFTGNEIGGLVAWWQWHFWTQTHPGQSGKDTVYMLNSTVSSKIVKSMARIEGFEFDETDTGFKNMGKRAVDLRAQGKTVLLAWEEAIGYMPSAAPDKDGVITVGLFAQYTVYLHSIGLTFSSHLLQMQQKYGFHLNRTSYLITPSPQITANFFHKLRVDKKYPTRVGEHNIVAAIDHTTGYDSRTQDNKMLLPANPSNQMIALILENGSSLIIRESGTEPKIKYYIEYITSPNKDPSELPGIINDLNRLEDAVVTQLFDYSNNGLLLRKS